jgi:hypothetical protein
LTVEEPDGLPGAEPVGPSLAWIDADSGGYWVIEPEDNQGLRLILRATT